MYLSFSYSNSILVNIILELGTVNLVCKKISKKTDCISFFEQ